MNISNSEQFVKIADGSFKPFNEKFYETGTTVVYKCKPDYYTKRFKATQGTFQIKKFKSMKIFLSCLPTGW